MSQCKCTMGKKLTGDGCEICNPEKALELAKETIKDLETENIILKEAVEWLRECSKLHDDNAVFYMTLWCEYEIYASLKAARAEVDRILMETE